MTTWTASPQPMTPPWSHRRPDEASRSGPLCRHRGEIERALAEYDVCEEARRKVRV